MSANAHKVKKIEYADSSFNIHHDEAFMDLLGLSVWGRLNADGYGMFELTRDKYDYIKNKWKQAKSSYSKEEVVRVEEILKQLEKDFGKDDFVKYYCF